MLEFCHAASGAIVWMLCVIDLGIDARILLLEISRKQDCAGWIYLDPDGDRS